MEDGVLVSCLKTLRAFLVTFQKVFFLNNVDSALSNGPGLCVPVFVLLVLKKVIA